MSGPSAHHLSSTRASPRFGCDLRGSESDRFSGSGVWVQFGLPGPGFGFGSVSPGQVLVRFGFVCPVRVRFGIGSDSALKSGAMPMRIADAMSVEIQLFTNRYLMKTTGLPCCLPIAPFADYCGCGLLY